MKLHIFPHQSDFHLPPGIFHPPAKGAPFLQVRLAAGEVQRLAGDAVQPRLVQHQGDIVKAWESAVFDDALRPHITEEGQFLQDPRLQGLIAPGNDDVRDDAQAPKLPHRVLGGLGLVLPGAPQVGHQHHMEEEAVLPSHLPGKLADGLQEGLAFNIPDGSANLGDDNIRIGALPQGGHKPLNLPGDVGNHLDSAAQVGSAALLVQNIPVHPPGGEVGIPVQVLIDEPLVMPQVQVGFRPVLGDKNLPMLVGAHGAGVHIHIGVQLLGRHSQAPRL